MLSESTKATFRLLFATALMATLMIFATKVVSAQEVTLSAQTTNTQQNTNAQVVTNQNVPASSNSNAMTPAPAPEPVYKDYRGATIGMSAKEVRDKLDHLRHKGKAEDDFDFSNGETAQIYYDSKGNARVISVTYFGKKSDAPTPQAVLGGDVPAKKNGSVYKLVRYPQAGYWVAYNRTAGDSPLVTVTMQKLRTQKKVK